LRRRRALRELDSLAQHPARQLSPEAAVAHVRVIGDEDPVPVGVGSGWLTPTRAIGENTDGETDSGQMPAEAGNASDRLFAVPIDQPLGASLQSATQDR
jgi:hypothetical protein